MKCKYTKEILTPIIKECVCVSDVLRKLNVKITGGNHAHIKKVIIKNEIDTSHFLGQASTKGMPNNFVKLHWSEILTFNQNSERRRGAHILRRALMESGILYKCCECGIGDEWNKKKITLEVDHVDGNWKNNERTNLRFLCPNCHSQTANWCAKNINKKQENLNFCCDCNKPISNQGVRCKSCIKRPTKIIWLPTEKLIELVKQSSFLAVARKLGVSDNAVRKRIKNHPS